MNKKVKRTVAVLLVLSLTLGLAACGSSNDSKEETSNETETINVGTMGTYNPFSFTKEDGTITGYDIEVLREIEKVDSSLKFNFIAGPWDSLFVGLDADKFQMLANQIT